MSKVLNYYKNELITFNNNEKVDQSDQAKELTKVYLF